MHSIKSDARRLAWADNKNPFAKYRPAHSRTQQGPGSALARTDTDPENASRYWLGTVGERSTEPTARPHFESPPPSPVSRPQRVDTESTLENLTPIRRKSSLSVTTSAGKVAYVEKHSSTPADNQRLAAPATSIPLGQRAGTLGALLWQWVVTLGSVLWHNPSCLLFAFVPAGFIVNYIVSEPTTIFSVNLVAMVPSALLIDYYIDIVAESVGEILNGLLSTTFSNIVLLITSIFLLKSNQLAVLQYSLLGSIISNLLLMTGMSFLLGGIPRKEQFFDKTLAQSLCTLLLLAILSLLIPTASHLLTNATSSNILAQSRGTAVIILISYLLWLLFQLGTHNDMFRLATSNTPPSQLQPKIKSRIEKLVLAKPKWKPYFEKRRLLPPEPIEKQEDEEVEKTTSSTNGGDPVDTRPPRGRLITAIAIVMAGTTILAFNTEFATNNIQGLLHNQGVSQMFIGFVVLPLVSNDHLSVLSAVNDKMNTSLSLTLGRCMQTSLMVVPSVVMIAWGMSRDLTLEFDGFSIAALFASMIMVSYVVQEGKSNWLVGALLIKAYVIVGLAAFYIH